MEDKNLLPSLSTKKALEPIDPFKRYVQKVNQYPFLSAREEKKLARQYIETGDREAAKKLVTSHLRLVVKIALEYKTAYGNMLDLVQEGNLGLMRAIKKYDPDKGARLSSYAGWWIRSYILKYILDNFRLIKIGTTQAQRRIFFNLMKEKERIEKAGFRPDSQLLAEALSVKPEEVEEMQGRLQKSDLSLDAPVGDEGHARQIEYLKTETPAYEENYDREKFKDILEFKLKEFSESLNDRETKIFKERLLSEVPLTLQAIADEYSISRERARQIESKLKDKLKSFFEKEGLKVEEQI